MRFAFNPAVPAESFAFTLPDNIAFRIWEESKGGKRSLFLQTYLQRIAAKGSFVIDFSGAAQGN